MMREVEVPIEAASSGSVSARMRYRDGRRVMWVASRPTTRRGALSERDGHRIARAADLANRLGIPLVLELSTSGAKITDGVSALHGWGIAASALARCSGRIPILAGLVGPAVSGPALLLGVADWVVVAPDAFAFLSGPQAVREVTGLDVSNQTLGGSQVLLARSGVAFEAADDRRGSKRRSGVCSTTSRTPPMR